MPIEDDVIALQAATATLQAQTTLLEAATLTLQALTVLQAASITLGVAATASAQFLAQRSYVMIRDRK